MTTAQPSDSNLIRRTFDDRHFVLTGTLPNAILPNETQFEGLWAMRPAEFPSITMLGRSVKAPRWYRAYGHDYQFSGQLSEAFPVPSELAPFLAWAHDVVNAGLNGILVNWYDGGLKHYIGKHRDSRHGLVKGSPIVTVSLGSTRVFRLRPWKATGSYDFTVDNGSVLILPWETNLAFTHEVLHTSTSHGQRMSLTFRAFDGT